MATSPPRQVLLGRRSESEGLDRLLGAVRAGESRALGGAETVTYGRAVLLLASYGALAVIAGATLFARRDVAT